MGDVFNPYSHWLKLPPQRWKPTYYEILGIDRNQTDKDAIIAIGKKLYAEVKAAPLAGREKEQRALLAEIEAAVRTFASNTKRAEYDSHLEPAIGDDHSGEPVETKLQATVPTALLSPKAPSAPAKPSVEPLSDGLDQKSKFAMPPMAVPAAKPAIPISAQPLPQAINSVADMPVAKPIAVAPVVVSPVAVATPLMSVRKEGAAKSLAAATAARHRQQQSKQNMILIAMSLGGILLMGMLGFVFRGEIQKALARAPSSPADVDSGNNIERVVNTRPSGEKSGTSNTSDPDGPPVSDADSGENKPGTSDPSEVKPNGEMNPIEAEPEKSPMPSPEMKPDAEPTPPAAPIVFTAAESAQLKGHCEAIIAALKSRDFAKATAELEAAELLAKPASVKESIEKLAAVVGSFRAFWHAYEEGWKALKVGDEIAVGASTKVKITELGENEIEIETASGKRKQSRESLSIGLLLAIVRTKLDLATPDGKLALGVFHLLDKAGNAEEGAKLLEEVNSNAVSAASVKELLAAKYDFASEVTGMAPSESTPDSNPETAPVTSPANVDSKELVSKLRLAQSDRKFDEAKKASDDLAKIAAMPGADPSLAAEVELAKYSAQFWTLVSKGMATFSGTEEIMVGDELIVVIEKTPKTLICRIRGRRSEFTLENMPAALALAIADMTSDKSAAGYDLAVGAMHFTKKPSDAKKAKECWEAARAKSAKSADLLLTLMP
jgi:hypothetical protein